MLKKTKTSLRAKFAGKDYEFLHPKDVDEWNLCRLYYAFGMPSDPVFDCSPSLARQYPVLSKFLPSFDPDDVERLFHGMRADPSTKAVVSPHLQKVADEYLNREPVPKWLEGRVRKIIWLFF